MSDMNVTATIQGISELKDAFTRLSDAAAEDALRQAGMAGALPIQNAAKQNAPRKTRTLSRSIHSEVTEVDRNHVVVEIGTDVVYAAIQEFGGTITAKNAAHLAIPITDEARSYKPRDFPRKLHAQGAGGMVAVLVDESGSVQYILKVSVTIPAQPYLRPALAEHQQEAIDAAGDVLAKLIEGAAKG